MFNRPLLGKETPHHLFVFLLAGKWGSDSLGIPNILYMIVHNDKHIRNVYIYPLFFPLPLGR
jgi:hypothetical protein